MVPGQKGSGREGASMGGWGWGGSSKANPTSSLVQTSLLPRSTPELSHHTLLLKPFPKHLSSCSRLDLPSPQDTVSLY